MATPQQTHSEKEQGKTKRPLVEPQTEVAQQAWGQAQTLPTVMMQTAVQNPSSASPQTILQMQRLYGNHAVSQMIMTSRSTPEATIQRQSSPVPDIQRGIKKPGKKGDTYQRAPTSQGGKKFSGSMRAELQLIIDNDERTKAGYHLSLSAAIARAKRRVGMGGKFVMGRKGTRINDSDEMFKYLRTKRKVNISVAQTKFQNHPKVWDDLFNKVELMQEDFDSIKFSGNGQSVWSGFTSTITQVVPQTILTISGFNEVVDEMVSNESHTGSALKGSMFEKWSLDNVLSSANNRVTFQKQGSMNQKRISDGYNIANQTLWDMKHYYKKMGQSTNNDQAADYDEIVKQGYTSQNGGYKVTTVNYLFPSKEGAKANKWLATTYGFGVYYVAEPTNLVKYA